MSPEVARQVVQAFARAPRTAPEGAPVALGCECGWESPYGPRRDGLRALRRHLIRCH